MMFYFCLFAFVVFWFIFLFIVWFFGLFFIVACWGRVFWGGWDSKNYSRRQSYDCVLQKKRTLLLHTDCGIELLF